MPRYHQWPNYEVLELLTTDVGVLCGFSVLFSNGNKATYSRDESGTRAINVTFEKNGGVKFFVGSHDDLEPVWKIDGKPVDDWDAPPGPTAEGSGQSGSTSNNA